MSNENLDQIVELCVDSLNMESDAASKTIQWAQTSNMAEVFLVFDERNVVGMLQLEWAGTEWNRIAEIGLIAVKHEYRRNGFGTRLITEMEDYAREKGFRKLYVEPRVGNLIALHFYLANGFVPEGTRKDWYRDGEDSIILGKHL